MTQNSIKTADPIVERFETELVYRAAPSEGVAARRRTLKRLDVLWKKRRSLLKVLLGSIVASLTLALALPKEYKSTVELMPPDQSSSGIAALASLAGRSTGTGALAGLAGDLLGQKTSGDLFIGVLGSRSVETALVTKFDLRNVYKVKLWEDAGRKLAKRTKLTEDKKSGIITIAVTDRSPQRAAQMAQEYVNQLDWVMTQLNTSSAHRERVFLEDRLRQVQSNLENAETNFGQFASKNAAVDIPEQGKAMLEAASTLEGQLIAAQTELQGLKEIYADTNVRVKAMQARVEELQRQVEKLGGTPESLTSAGSGSVEAMYPSIRQLPLLGVQYADLLRATKVQEAVFESLTQEYELAKVAEAKEIPSVKVLDPPNIPERKSYPPRRLITIFGTLFVFGAGVLWILGTERWNRIDPRDETKSFVTQVYGELLDDLPWLARRIAAKSRSNGSAPQAKDAEA